MLFVALSFPEVRFSTRKCPAAQSIFENPRCRTRRECKTLSSTSQNTEQHNGKQTFHPAILFLFGRSIRKGVSVYESDIPQNSLRCAETIYLISRKVSGVYGCMPRSPKPSLFLGSYFKTAILKFPENRAFLDFWRCIHNVR